MNKASEGCGATFTRERIERARRRAGAALAELDSLEEIMAALAGVHAAVACTRVVDTEYGYTPPVVLAHYELACAALATARAQIQLAALHSASSGKVDP